MLQGSACFKVEFEQGKAGRLVLGGFSRRRVGDERRTIVAGEVELRLEAVSDLNLEAGTVLLDVEREAAFPARARSRGSLRGRIPCGCEACKVVVGRITTAPRARKIPDLLIRPLAQYRKDVFEPEVSRAALAVDMQSAEMGFERLAEVLARRIVQFGAVSSERERERRLELSVRIVYEGDLSKSCVALQEGAIRSEEARRRRVEVLDVAIDGLSDGGGNESIP